MEIYVDRVDVENVAKTRLILRQVSNIKGPHYLFLNDRAMEWIVEKVEERVSEEGVSAVSLG